jgi:hypothetical protein
MLQVSTLIDFAALGAIKENPGSEIISEILETVLDPSSDKQHVKGLKLRARRAADEFAAALRYDIDFVARMWRLCIIDARSIQFGYERSMLEQGDDIFFLRTGQAPDGFGQIYLDADVATHGDGDNNTLQCNS